MAARCGRRAVGPPTELLGGEAADRLSLERVAVEGDAEYARQRLGDEQ